MDFGLSVLDVSPASSGSNGPRALRNTLELARLTDWLSTTTRRASPAPRRRS
jgi:hypothetical protein